MDSIIEEKEKVKDLGVLIDYEAQFKPQREKAIMKARSKAGWVLRTFSTRDSRMMVTLWKSLVQPHLDYCSQLWAPVDQVGDLREQEEPLRAFTRKVDGCWYLDYWQRLKRLGLLSCQRRVERYKIIYMWKMLMGMAPDIGIKWNSRNMRIGHIITVPKISGQDKISNMRESPRCGRK